MRTVWLLTAFALGVLGAALLLVPPAVSSNYSFIMSTLTSGVLCVLAALLALDQHHRT